MKEETVYFDDITVVYYIGTNAADNFLTIDKGNYWFHAKHVSSCHVVVNIPEGVDKQGIRKIIKRGALICKQNTAKLKSLNNIEFIYTQIKNVTKTELPGMVHVTNEKTIVC